MIKLNSKIKIGIIGFGSIAIKHTEELIKLGVTNFFALRTGKGAKSIPKSIKQFLTNIYNENEFLELEMDGYIISNPTSLHIQALNIISNKNKPVFVEKPICHSLKELDKLNYHNKNLIQMGFCLRFHNLTIAVKEILDKNQLGQIYHSRHNVGQYLPTWHPYTDYKTEYFSLKNLGGGAIRTLSHELDLAVHFFGIPQSHKSLQEKVSNLEIDVDDYSLVLLKYKNHTSRIEMDFISKKTERKGTIFGTDADLHYDYVLNLIEIIDNEGNQIERKEIKTGNMYNSQMMAFINLIITKELDIKISTFNENVNILKVIENDKSI